MYICQRIIIKTFMELFHKMISAALNISEKQVSNTLNLLKDGATIPFISRYRKKLQEAWMRYK